MITLLGGTGFIGPEVVAQLLDQDHEVTLVHRGVHPNAVAGVHDVLADPANAVALRLAVPRSDVVIDMCAMNATQAKTASAALRDRTACTVVLSSQDVYAQFGGLLGHPSPPPESPITEDSPLTVPQPYEHIDGSHDGDYDKKDVERVYRGSKIGAVTILRLPAVYGSEDPNRRFGMILDALDAGDSQLPRIGGKWRWTHAHVRDVARAIVLAAERAEPGTFNVGEAETPTMSERAEAIARHAGHRFTWREVDVLDDAFEHLGGMVNDVVVSSERIRSRLGFTEITNAEERLADLISGLRKSR